MRTHFMITREKLSPIQFSRLASSRPDLIRHSEIVPPVLGKSGFGSIVVEYNSPLRAVGETTNNGQTIKRRQR